MDTLTTTQQIDLALVKRDAARNYQRSRQLLRLAVEMGIVDAADVRARKHAVREYFTTWRAARALLRG